MAQQSPLWDNLQQFGLDNPQEKVYLHLDKPNYLTGDDLWLKGYVTIGPQNQFSAMSKILYVDLIGPGNKVVSANKYLILHGVSIGDMHLPDTLEQGTYHIRAYTNYMRNSPPETYFNSTFNIGRPQPDATTAQTSFNYNPSAKQLSVNINLATSTGVGLAYLPVYYTLQFAGQISGSGNAKTDNAGNVLITFNKTTTADLTTGVLDLKYSVNNHAVQKSIAVIVQQPENQTSFMPEGGSMVAGLQSRVAFKMLQPDGFGATGNGYITDETGTKLTDFASGYAGMGSFYFTPQPGKNYKAVITYANGKNQTVSLPPALAEGYNLALYPHFPAFVSAAITVSPQLVKNQTVTLLVQRQGKILFVGQKVINNAESLSKIPLDNYPSGIIQLTLFDENLHPVCERLFFNLKKQTTLPLSATTDNEHYKTRQTVTVNLSAGESTDSSRIGSFSASIVNLSISPQLKNNRSGILPGLLLNPELKGYVENPDHYFEENTPERLAELDNLVLCQGWRRIVWNDIATAKQPVIDFKPEQSFAIAGSVTRGGKPVANAKVSLMSTTSFKSIDTLTDANGRYVFDRLLLKDSTRFAVRARDPEQKHTLALKVDKQAYLTPVLPYGDIEYPTDAAYQAFLKKSYTQLPDSTKLRLANYNVLKQVEINGLRDKKTLVTYSSNLNGPGKADQVFLPDDMKNSFNLQQVLEGRAMGIRFLNNKPYSTRQFGGSHSMRIILDGVPLIYATDGDPPSDTDEDPPTHWIPVDDIASVEIIRSVEYSAVYGTNSGIILITTKLGHDDKYASKTSPEYVPLMLKGYNTIREFYSPQYDVPAKASQTTDHRSTIYWKPDIITNKTGNASFKFYTSDDKGTYQLNIQGITVDGRPAQVVKSFVVE